MAERRMFTMKIVDSDAFLEMPMSTQSLYFHLNMRADDDGFVNNPKRIQRMVGASEDDLKLLLVKRFILGFENGVVVIKHWRMHNLLRKDRYNPTQYVEEKATLTINENGAYTERAPIECLATTWQPNGNQMATQDSIGKDRIGKESIVEDIELDSAESKAPRAKKAVKHKHGEYRNVLLTDAEYERLTEDFGDRGRDDAIRFLDEYIEEKGYKSKSHNLAIRRWVIDAVNRDKPQKAQSSNGSYDTDDFFNAALKRSLSPREALERQAAARMEDKTVEKTTGDPELMRRAEELKSKISNTY